MSMITMSRSCTCIAYIFDNFAHPGTRVTSSKCYQYVIYEIEVNFLVDLLHVYIYVHISRICNVYSHFMFHVITMIN